MWKPLTAALIAGLATTMTLSVDAQAARSAEQAETARWFASHFEGRQPDLPFSFRYAGKPSSDLLTHWTLKRSATKLDANRLRTTLAWTDPQTHLVVRCATVSYSDFPTVEWTVTFKNEGAQDTPILSDVHGLDTSFRRAGTDEFLLHHQTGSPCEPNDYQPFVSDLKPGFTFQLGARAGRGTDPVLPYFNLENTVGGGAILAVGWPAQWAASFQRDAGDGLHIRAGQEITHLILHPGEEIRTPLTVVQRYAGDWIGGQNTWRRWMLAHNVPRPGGKLPPAQIVACSSHQYGEMIHANEANQIMFVDRYLEEGIKLDYWWMDAGWYINDGTWPNTGTWEVDPKRFPHGLRAITDHAHAKGVKSIVWFEPERVTPGTFLYEHPKWLLGMPNPTQGLTCRRLREIGTDPCATFNGTDKPITGFGVTWVPGHMALHPGPSGEYAVARWTAPKSGKFVLSAEFVSIAEHATTDVHVLLDGKAVFDGGINIDGQGSRAVTQQDVEVRKGDRLDFVVGWGNGNHQSDSTGVNIALKDEAGKTDTPADPAAFAEKSHTAWTFGVLSPGKSPDAATFRPFNVLTTAGGDSTKLLNLGNPEARKWLTDHTDKTLREQGIDLYRQDYNIDPLAFWQANDAKDRQGITENLYVQGYLAFWDELRKRHPNMLIDSCASGGRRNDLETLRRAVPLLRSDYILEPVGQQGHTYGISLWMPYYGTGVNSLDTYVFRSQMCPSITACYDMRPEHKQDFGPLRTLYAQWKEIAPLYFGDYYPLTDYSLSPDSWIAWQFVRPEHGDGMVEAFRRAETAEDSRTLKLRGLDPEARYQVKDVDTGEVRQASGRSLMAEGLAVTISNKPGNALLTLKKL